MSTKKHPPHIDDFVNNPKFFEIYFCDLTEEAGKQLLEFYGISSPEEANWDIQPIHTFYLEEDEETDDDENILLRDNSDVWNS